MSTVYDKLVRDEIPAIIRGNGQTPITEQVRGEDYERRLEAKLEEEVEEYLESGATDELADILEVVHALREQHGLTSAALESIRESKAADRGRFEEGIILKRVED